MSGCFWVISDHIEAHFRTPKKPERELIQKTVNFIWGSKYDQKQSKNFLFQNITEWFPDDSCVYSDVFDSVLIHLRHHAFLYWHSSFENPRWHRGHQLWKFWRSQIGKMLETKFHRLFLRYFLCFLGCFWNHCWLCVISQSPWIVF